MGVHEIHRRSLLCWMGAIGLGFVGTIVVSLLRSFGFNPWAALSTTVWSDGQRLVTNDGKPISVNAMPPGSTAIVFPENDTDSEKAQTVLIRVDPSMLRLPAERSDWAPQGYVAYSRVCTHAGCVVGLYEATAHLLMCPCHQSTFDILRAAQPTGGPAARPLPQLPLYADSEGFLRAGGGFSDYPGPGYWGMPE
jgi:ubiquinol-cytochrome c reductase iron-sulfur subunit